MNLVHPAPADVDALIPRHGPEGFEGMRKAGRLAAEVLDLMVGEVRPGVTTAHLDDLARTFILDHGALPACLGYRGYQHTLCTSINHVICHGIPGPKPLKNGDIVNIDVTVIVDGWHGDTSRMYVAGEPKVKARRLMDVTYECLERGIAAVRPGATPRDVARAVQSHAEAERFSVVTQFCGHGLGRRFHSYPNIMHADTGEPSPSYDIVFEPGMFFTIEPMINEGRPDGLIKKDGWTAVTRDKSLSAQYEHSLGVTETGAEIFTLSPKGLNAPHTLG